MRTSKMYLTVLVLVCSLLAACSSPPKTPEDFLKTYYMAVSTDTDKAMSLYDSQTVPAGDKSAAGFVQGMLQGDQSLYQSHGGIESIIDIKTWTAKRDAKYTGFSLTLQFKDGKAIKGRGYLLQENGQWRMTTAANQG